MELEQLIDTLNFSSILWQIITPIIFNCADVITGFTQAIINHDLDSQKMRQGLLHKFLLIIVVFLSFILDLAFSLTFVSKIVCVYIVVMETVSIIENLSKAGLDFGKLTEILNIKGRGK